MAVREKNLKSTDRLVGVFATAAAYLTDRNKTAAEEGDTYYDKTLNQLRNYDGSSWSPAGQNGNTAGSLDDAANIGTKITIDGGLTGGVEIEATDAIISTDGQLLLLDNDDVGSDVHCLECTNAGTGPSIIITGQSGGDDIQGSNDTWAIDYDGVGTFTNLVLGDGETIALGASTDAVFNFDGTTLILSTATDDVVFEIGDSAATQLSWDIKWYGNTTNGADFLYFDASANLIYTTGVDLQFLDSDVLALGTGAGGAGDFNFTYDGTDLLFETETADLIWKIGATNNMDIIIYGDTATDLITFDTSDELVHFDGFDLQLKDADRLEFGDLANGDLIMNWDSANFLIEAGAQDTGQIRIGSTNAIDLVIYDNAATGTVTYDVSTSTVDINGWDTRHQDDDYLLLGDSATAGADTDATLRWDATNSELEIIGKTRFEDNVAMDGNLTLSGTLTMSGALAPGSIALGDTEILSFGDGTDYTISTAGSTAALIIAAQVADDAVQIGDGSTATDFIIQNTTTSGADVWWDDSGETFYFGASNIGVDVQFYGDTTGADMLWDEDADMLVLIGGSAISLNDDVELLLGTGSSNAGDWKIYSDGATLFVAEISSAGKGIEIGVDNKGCDFKMFGETSGDYCEFTQASDAYYFEDIDIALGDGTKILFGDTLGTGDVSLESSAGVLTWAIVSAVEIKMGGDGKGIDQTWYAETTSDYMKWDQDGNTNLGLLIFEDSGINMNDDSPILFGDSGGEGQISSDGSDIVCTGNFNYGVDATGVDVTFYGDTASSNMIWDQDGDTNGSLILTGASCTITGIDSTPNVLTLTGVDTTGNTDTLLIDHSGDGYAINIDLNEATSDGINIEPFTNATVPALMVDGDTAGYLGGDASGMVHLQNDIAGGHANATLLLIDKQDAGVAEVNSAEGSCLRIVENMDVSGSPPAYAMYISCVDNEALHVDSGTVVVDETVQVDAGIKFSTTTTMMTDKIEITNTQLKALNATPKELVATKGADAFIEFCGAVLVMDYGTNVLTESADNLDIEYDGGTGPAVCTTIECTGFIDQAADQIAAVVPIVVAGTTTAASTVNKNLVLLSNEGDFGGNAGNDTTMTVFVSYKVHTVGLV